MHQVIEQDQNVNDVHKNPKQEGFLTRAFGENGSIAVVIVLVICMILAFRSFSSNKQTSSQEISAQNSQSNIERLKALDADDYEDPFTSEKAEELEAKYLEALSQINSNNTQIFDLTSRLDALSKTVALHEKQFKALLTEAIKKKKPLNYDLLGTHQNVNTNEWVAEIKVNNKYKRVMTGDMVNGHLVTKVGANNVVIY